MSYNGRNRHHGPRNGHGRGGRDLDIQMANGPRSTNNENPRTHYNQHYKNRQGRDWHNWSNDGLAFTNERRPLVHEDKGSSGSGPRHPGNQYHYRSRGQYQRPQNYDGARYQGTGQPDRRRGHPWNQQDRGQAKSETAGGNRHPMFDRRFHPAGQQVYGGKSNENNQNGQRRPNGIYDADGDIKMVDVFQLGETSVSWPSFLGEAKKTRWLLVRIYQRLEDMRNWVNPCLRNLRSETNLLALRMQHIGYGNGSMFQYLPRMDTLSPDIKSELQILARMHHYAVSVIQWCGINQEFKDRVWEANALAQKIQDVAQALQEIGQAAQSIGYVNNYVQSRSHTSQTLQAETHLLESMHGQTLVWQTVFQVVSTTSFRAQNGFGSSRTIIPLWTSLRHPGDVEPESYQCAGRRRCAGCRRPGVHVLERTRSNFSRRMDYIKGPAVIIYVEVTLPDHS
ncbi:hypothetical protein N7513_004970 [Penicillium frequentans]|nr:hypothetical protein N7513_004970 [Penicillium glabrum]